MKFSKTSRMAFVCGLLSWLCVQAKIQACGMDWSEPRSFFENVDYQGHVHVIERLGELSVGNLKLPIYLIFNSSNQYSSPYSGLLEIPLLTSRMEQLDDNTFLLRSPSGWLLPFVRNGKINNVLDGSLGMKAEIDDKTSRITAWSECGDRLTFSRGHITQLQLKGVKLDYIYSGNQVSEIRDGSGKTVLKVNADSQTKGVDGLSLGSNPPIVFRWGEMPTGVQQVLTKVVLPDGAEKSFEFGRDAQMHPTLKVNGKQEMSWDPMTLFAYKVDDWSYKVEPGKERFANAAIERTNSKGQTEFWHYDGERGSETIIDASGKTEKRTWFTSGKLAGRDRTLERTFVDGRKIVSKLLYNENGKVIRRNYKESKRGIDSVISYQYLPTEVKIEFGSEAVSNISTDQLIPVLPTN